MPRPSSAEHMERSSAPVQRLARTCVDWLSPLTCTALRALAFLALAAAASAASLGGGSQEELERRIDAAASKYIDGALAARRHLSQTGNYYINPGATDTGDAYISPPSPQPSDLQRYYGFTDVEVASGAVACSGLTCTVWGLNSALATPEAAASVAQPTYRDGDTAWMLAAGPLVMIMTPGLGLFYAGMSGSKTATNTIMMSFICMGVVTVQWVVIGYSFAFGPGSAGYGSFRWVALTVVGRMPSAVYGPTIPHYAFVFFQCMFAQITPALISGAIVGRMKFSSYVIFVLAWSFLVYDAVAHWVWGLVEDGAGTTKGWLSRLGALDFAGGTVIHITSGWSALVVALMVGKRRDHTEPVVQHNVPMCLIGTALLWFGWFGFNGGSQLAADGVAAMAVLNTHIAAATGLVVWLAMDLVFEKRISAVGAASGAVVGLVAITPACGFVTPMASIAIGAFGAAISFGACFFKKHIMNIDDTLDVWACHGVGGVTGAVMTGLFANEWSNPLSAMDRNGNMYYITKGAFYGRGMLLGYQLAGVVVAIGYAMTCTALLLLALKYTLGLRVADATEDVGIDRSIHGSHAYSHYGLNPVALKYVNKVMPGEDEGSLKGDVEVPEERRKSAIRFDDGAPAAPLPPRPVPPSASTSAGGTPPGSAPTAGEPAAVLAHA